MEKPTSPAPSSSATTAHPTLHDNDQDGDDSLSMAPPTEDLDDDDDDDDHSDSGSELERSQTNHGEPDVDRDAVQAETPGRAFDRELERTHDIEALRRVETRSSARVKMSRVLTGTSRRSRKDGKDGKDGIRVQPLPVSDLDKGVVGWEGQDDPAMPLNFSAPRKWLLVALVSIMTFTTPFTSSILSPAIDALDDEFGNNSSLVGSLTVSIYLLGYCIGPLFLAPLSEIYGRRPVLSAANAFYCVWQIGCALAPNISSLIVFRLFAGIGGSGCMTLGGGVISDIFRPSETGFAMGVWNLGPTMGPTIGPLVGGFISETIGWRWDFWLCLIQGVILTAALHFLSQETNPRVLIGRKVKRLARETGRTDLRSCYTVGTAVETMTKAQVLRNGLSRPSKMLVLSPLVFFLSLYVSFVYGVMYLLFTTIPPVFETTYGFSVGLTGLVYLALGFGNLVGWAVVALYSDRSVVRLARANGGRFEPEMRLATTIGYGLFLPVTFFWYGWCTRYRVHYMAAIFSLVPFGFGMMGIFMPIVTYLVDAYPMYAASAIAANTVLRSLVGALLPLAGPTMYDRLGYGWGNSILGFISLAMVPVPLLIYRYGGKLRAMQKFQL